MSAWAFGSLISILYRHTEGWGISQKSEDVSVGSSAILLVKTYGSLYGFLMNEESL